MKVLLSGGGTAGHVNPALAVARRLERTLGAEILFIGTKEGMESRLVPKEGWPIRYIQVEGLIRRPTLKNFTVLKKLITARARSKAIIKEFAPDLVIGTGGYVCAPVLSAAHALGVPALIHEQNVIPGMTVKLAARHANIICISFPETIDYLKPAYTEKCVLTGNPIREEMLTISREEARQRLNLDERPFIVAFGGSLGAWCLNEAAIDFLNNADTARFQFLLGTGQRYYEKVRESIKKCDPSIQIAPYIDQMDLAMAAADLVIGRAGALTVSELCALGKPAILIPSPNVAHDHQTYNAKSMEKAGGALVIADKELNGKQLDYAIFKIIDHPEKIRTMAQSARRAGITDGAKRICDAALALL